MNGIFSRRWVVLVVLAGFCSVAASWAGADVRLPAVFSDNMVLQRGASVPVWGWADPGEQVTVSIPGQTKATSPDASGKWMLRLDPIREGGPFTMTVQGKNNVTFRNILMGEVWLCSGQSNMQWTVVNSNNAEEDVAAANYPRLRLISVPQRGTQEPQDNFEGSWAECSPETVKTFSAVAYFFGRHLHKELDIPVGLIHCSWGGSACEAWVKRAVLQSDPQYAALLDRWEKTMADYNPDKVQAVFDAQLARWKKAAAAAKTAGKPRPAAPRAPADPRIEQHRPANCYNGMLLPLIPYAIRGAIWYQGETNAGRAYQYRSLFPLMIESWRADWQQGDFPFYFVQLANFKERKAEPGDSDWAELREAQAMTLRVPNTGMAVTIDIGEAADIHPRNKQDVGRRLALWALAKDYGCKVEYSGPTYRSMARKGNKISLEFDHVGGGLIADGGKGLEGFSIAGADRKFVWADAQIVGHSVVVGSPAVKEPVAVRYAWADNPACNLYNKEGVPASPFRTDDWPGITVDAKAP